MPSRHPITPACRQIIKKGIIFVNLIFKKDDRPDIGFKTAKKPFGF